MYRNTSAGQFTPIHATLLAKSNESHCAFLCMCFVDANALIVSVLYVYCAGTTRQPTEQIGIIAGVVVGVFLALVLVPCCIFSCFAIFQKS